MRIRERDKPYFVAHERLLRCISFRLGKRKNIKRQGIISVTLNAEYIVLYFERQTMKTGDTIETIAVSYMEYTFAQIPFEKFQFMPHDLTFVLVNGVFTKLWINDREYYYKDIAQSYGNMKDAFAVIEVLFDKIGVFVPT